MRRIFSACILFGLCISISTITAVFAEDTNNNCQINAHQILKTADHSRGNIDGVIWEVELKSYENDKLEQERTIDIKAKGYNFLGTFLAPAKIKNSKILMADHNMWYTKPGLRKPVPVSPKQKLVGGASYGDLAATNYADDYDATFLGYEQVQDEQCYVFELKASAENVTYENIKYWVSKERTVGVKAEYYSVSGKLLKLAMFEYEHQISIPDNGSRPFISKMKIEDMLMQGNITYLSFSQPELKELKPSTFNVNRLNL